MLCAYAGLELEDYRFESRDVFTEMKESGKLAFGQAPLLEVTMQDGTVHQLVQSTAILRYLGKIGGLYPNDDDLLAAKVDAALAQETDAFTGATVATYTKRFGICLDEATLKKSEELIATETTPRHLQSLEKLLETSTTGWIAGTKEPSPADFVWYVRLDMYMPSSPKFFPETLCQFGDYPHVKAFVEKFKSLDNIKAYYAKKK